jgi:hypothetical protein
MDADPDIRTSTRDQQLATARSRGIDSCGKCQLIDADALLRRSPNPVYRRPVVDSVEAVNNVPVNNVPEPIPERLRDVVWRAEDTGDPNVLAALSAEDYDTAVRYLKGIQANLAQVLDTPGTTRP